MRCSLSQPYVVDVAEFSSSVFLCSLSSFTCSDNHELRCLPPVNIFLPGSNIFLILLWSRSDFGHRTVGCRLMSLAAREGEDSFRLDAKATPLSPLKDWFAADRLGIEATHPLPP